MTNKIDFLEHELDVNALIQGILTISSIDPSLGSLSVKANYSNVREVFLSNLLSLLKPKRLKKIYPFQNPTDFAKNINMIDTLTFGMPKYNEDIFSSDNITLILTNIEKMETGLSMFRVRGPNVLVSPGARQTWDRFRHQVCSSIFYLLVPWS